MKNTIGKKRITTPNKNLLLTATIVATISLSVLAVLVMEGIANQIIIHNAEARVKETMSAQQAGGGQNMTNNNTNATTSSAQPGNATTNMTAGPGAVEQSMSQAKIKEHEPTKNYVKGWEEG